MEHSEWLAQYLQTYKIIQTQEEDLKHSIEEAIIECLRRNNREPIKINIITDRLYELTTIRYTEDWNIVLDSSEEILFAWDELDIITKLNVYEACIKTLNLG